MWITKHFHGSEGRHWDRRRHRDTSPAPAPRPRPSPPPLAPPQPQRPPHTFLAPLRVLRGWWLRSDVGRPWSSSWRTALRPSPSHPGGRWGRGYPLWPGTGEGSGLLVCSSAAPSHRLHAYTSLSHHPPSFRSISPPPPPPIRYSTSLKTGKNKWFFQKLRF